MKRRFIFLVPFSLSLALSFSTVGNSVGWQDSGFFLSAVKEMGVLHPPGFVLYLLLCKAWTLLLFFLDFTLAVHLFSSFCAAAAAGTLAVAASELLRSRGALFRVGDSPSDAAAVAAGCLAASGYTFWASAITAKGYALYYLILSLLLWRMIRADETRRPRDLTAVAILIGLSWAAHPSATCAGPALVLFVAAGGRIGWKGIAWRSVLAAACAVGPSLLLPALASRETVTKFGEPGTFGEFVRYLRGARFTDRAGVFGFAPSRWESAGLFLWEELLGVGALAAIAGLARIATVNRRLLVGVTAWVVPIVAAAALFKIEGQLDFWLVAAWLALHLAAAVGLRELGRRAGTKAVGGLAAVGVAWAAAVNGPLLLERGNDLPAQTGRLFLRNVEPGAVVVLDSDDALATATYLRVVKGERADVTILSAARERPFPGRPLYYENPPPGRAGLVAAGALRKAGTTVDLREWDGFPPLGGVYARPRRARGQRVDGDRVEPERYERRMMIALVRARRELALWHLDFRTTEGYRKGAELLDSILAADPESRRSLAVVYPLGAARYALEEFDRAEPLLRTALELSPPNRVEAHAAYYLSVVVRKQGRRDEADLLRARAAAAIRGDPKLLSELEHP